MWNFHIQTSQPDWKNNNIKHMPFHPNQTISESLEHINKALISEINYLKADINEN